jgi:hypothetical protein
MSAAELAASMGTGVEVVRRWEVPLAERRDGKVASTPNAKDIGRLAALLSVSPGAFYRHETEDARS